MLTTREDNKCVEILNLSENRLGEGILHVAGVLKDNSVISQLLLKSNEIGNHGAAAIADAINKNDTTALAKIDLQKNKVKCQGAIALASILKVTLSRSPKLTWRRSIGNWSS